MRINKWTDTSKYKLMIQYLNELIYNKYVMYGYIINWLINTYAQNIKK